MRLHHIIIPLFFLFYSCDIGDDFPRQSEINQKVRQFDKENVIAQFNYNIGLIELHKTRFGEYPNTLDSLKYLNYWDAPNRYEYKKVTDGYILNAINDTINKMTATNLDIEDIKLPDSFWKGLGLVDSNLKNKN